MAEKKGRQFKTAEQKHKEKVILKCKVCGQKMQGKTTLSRHISHAHDEMDPADREKLVIDAYYGKDVVDRTIRKFRKGEYKNKAVPIDIGRYLRLAEIKPDEEKVQKKRKEIVYKEDPPKKEYHSDKELVKVKDLAEEEYHDKKVDKVNFYVEDAILDQESGKIELTITKGKTTAIDFKLLKKFIEENEAEDSMLYVTTGEEETYPVESVEIRDPDEAAGSQVKCIVAYDSTKTKKED